MPHRSLLVVALTLGVLAGVSPARAFDVLTEPNLPPTASFTVTCSGLTCSFDGTGSSDSDGTILEFLWQFGDGTVGDGAIVQHTFEPGTYTVTLTVVDDEGGAAWQSRTIVLPVIDGDGDGIPDSQDPDVIGDAVSSLPTGAFAAGADQSSSGAAHRTAFLRRLEEAEAMIASGDLQGAITALEGLRRKVDGCGTTADTNDWIVDCEAQRAVRTLIDSLLGSLP